MLPFLFAAAILLGVPASETALWLALLGIAASLLPRLIGAFRFRQSLLGAILHPLGVCALLAIQWFAFFRARRNRPAAWRGRFYFQPNLNTTETYVPQN